MQDRSGMFQDPYVEQDNHVLAVLEVHPILPVELGPRVRIEPVAVHHALTTRNSGVRRINQHDEHFDLFRDKVPERLSYRVNILAMHIRMMLVLEKSEQ